jgi:hypothetical protein
LLTSKLFFSSSPAMPESCLAMLFMFVRLRGIGTPSTRLRRRLAISARPAMAPTAAPMVATAAPLATVPAPLRAFSAIESTVLPIEPTLSPTASTFSEMPPPSDARLFALADLVRRLAGLVALEVDRAREAPDVFFAELPLLLAAEREFALLLGLAVLGKGSSGLSS